MFKIFPLTITHDGRKVPIKELANWKEKATNDPKQIEEWQRLYGHKIKLWGIPTGTANGILALDVDVKGGGLETIKRYQVPHTQSQQTRSGGMHYLFKYPNDGQLYGNKVGFDQGLDIRGENGYIAYYNLNEVMMTEAPEWLKTQAIAYKKKEIDYSNLTLVTPEIVNSILTEACANIRNAPEGESNNILNVESYNVGQLITSNSITYERAYNELFRAAKDRGKPDYEAKATIESGLKGGSENPYSCPFGNEVPTPTIEILPDTNLDRWTPPFLRRSDLTNFKKLRKPQLFKDWSTEDVHITTADGGTGKTTLKLNEAIALALGDSFLGFENITKGRTLFITGEDTQEKLGAMLGAILKQMGLLDGTPENEERVKTVLNSIFIKHENDMVIIDKDRNGFINPNKESLQRVLEAIEDLKPKMIVFDPISMFWGSEAALNDMSKAVAKFMAILVKQSNACVEVINHMGKSSSTTKDMSQFAGRGGTGLPSHARVSRVLRALDDEEYKELTGMDLDIDKSAMLCNVNKFSDGSPLFNNPFVILRDGYLFSRIALVEQKIKEEQDKVSDIERVFNYIKEQRSFKKYPTREVILAHFSFDIDKLSKERVTQALSILCYSGHMGEKVKEIDNPDVESSHKKAFILLDQQGQEK